MILARAAVLLFLLLVGAPLAQSQAPEQTENTQNSVVEKARVVSIEKTETVLIPGTDTETIYQTLKAFVLSGPDKGKTVTVENDYLELKVGDRFFLMHTVSDFEGIDAYTVLEPDRLPVLAVLFIVFVIAVIAVGGWTGVRGLLTLAASILLVFYALLPAISNGYDPFLVSIGVAGLIVIFGSYLTHGANRTTTAAVVGLLATVAVTATIAHFAIDAAHLSGFTDEDSIALHFATRGGIDFVGLLLGAMLIGALGILYDAAIGQAVAIEELIRAAPQMPVRTLFARGMRIGREHIGALVNTLVIAYVGAALPLLLLFQSFSTGPFLETINREFFATEIVRAIVGTLGILLTVPISTIVAILLLKHLRTPTTSHQQ